MIRVLAALALVLVAVPAMAQGGMGGQGGGMGPGGQGRGGMQQRQIEALFKGITLTPAQQASIDSLQTAQRESMRQMMSNGGMQDPSNRERMMQARETHFNDMRKVLTPEQAAIYDKNRAEMSNRGPQGAPPARPPQ